MKKINIKTNQKNHFIGCWNIEQNLLMDKLILYFENNPEKHEYGASGNGEINTETKDSIDISF